MFVAYLLLILAWLICGVHAFIWAWTENFDFTMHDLGGCFAASLLGPVFWLVILYNNIFASIGFHKVLIKKKQHLDKYY